jgi:hypothetical protein
MAAEDVLVSRELKSLQDELSASRKERVAATPGGTPPLAAEPVLETPDDRDLRDQLGQFAKVLDRSFPRGREGRLGPSPQSVVGALLVGILIGRLLGRRSGAVT